MKDQALASQAQSTEGWSYAQTIGASNVSPQWYGTLNAPYTGSSGGANIVWQGTTSGATYTAASTALQSG